MRGLYDPDWDNQNKNNQSSVGFIETPESDP